MFKFFNKKTQPVSISPSSIIFTAAFLLSLYFFYQIREIVIIFFMAFILMIALLPIVDKLQQYLKFRALSIFVVYTVLITFIAVIIAILIPPLANQLSQLLNLLDLPYFQEEVLELKFTTQELSRLATDYSGSINTLFTMVASTFKSLFTFITLIVVSFYLIIDEQNLHKKISWFTNREKHLKAARQFLDDVEEELGGWIRGQAIIMSIVGFLTYLGLTIIGVPYAVPLALLAFMLEILPNLGPFLAAVPGIIIAWIHGGHITAIIVAIFYLVLQQIESSLITPNIMKSSANVDALVTILGILSGFQIGGIIGGLLAVPIYILARTIYGYYLESKAK